ncbi:MAG: hypothetical protein Q8S15_05605 [Erysipelotrichaceae bacterium]|nr:hypothetical protein [Erysipelotrichaceae bacterium]MDP3305522.1 hypothetical protein [Erysipelotrichaceae bacterium]
MVSTILALLLVSQINQVTINQIIANSHDFDQSVIMIEAEVILEVLERNENAWINVNDGTNAIGVFLPLSMTADLEVFGDYEHQGDTVRVVGVFSRNCVEHGGEIDIHASSLEVIKQGVKQNHKVPVWKGLLALVGVSMSITALLLHRKRKVIMKFSNRFVKPV